MEVFFSVYSYPELFNSYNMNVRAFWVDADGKKVIGTRDGLYYISEMERRIRHYTPEFHFAFGYNFVCKTFQSGFLIGTYGGACTCFTGIRVNFPFFNQINVLCKGHLMDMKGM